MRASSFAGATLAGRTAIFFSADHLTAGLVGYSCWGLKGYEPDSAFLLMRNMVLYPFGRMPSGKTRGDGL